MRTATAGERFPAPDPDVPELEGGLWVISGSGDGDHRKDRRRRLRQRRTLQAGLGLLAAAAFTVGLRVLGFRDVDPDLLAGVVVLTVLVQAALWLLPRLGVDERLEGWDPHYVVTPLLAASLLLGLYIYVAPEGRLLFLMAWLVGLQYAAGFLGFRGSLGLTVVMAGVYAWSVAARAGDLGLDLTLEAYHGASFLLVGVFAALLNGELKRSRRSTRRLHDQLIEHALSDPLTGLPNRRCFELHMEAEASRVHRYGGTCCVALLDVDGFKELNDTLGHSAGDQVLQEVGSLFREHARESDVLCRYGGDEFALLMPNTHHRDAWDALDRFRLFVERHPFSLRAARAEGRRPSGGGEVTVSVGLAALPAHATEVNDLLEVADRALYRAKEGGRNRVECGN